MMTNPPSAKDELFTWLRHMNKYKGSDLFITTNFPPAMKVDGKITPITDEPLTSEKCMEIAFSIMSTKQIEEFSSTNECNFAISLPDTSRFRGDEKTRPRDFRRRYRFGQIHLARCDG